MCGLQRRTDTLQVFCIDMGYTMHYFTTVNRIFLLEHASAPPFPCLFFAWKIQFRGMLSKRHAQQNTLRVVTFRLDSNFRSLNDRNQQTFKQIGFIMKTKLGKVITQWHRKSYRPSNTRYITLKTQMTHMLYFFVLIFLSIVRHFAEILALTRLKLHV